MKDEANGSRVWTYTFTAVWGVLAPSDSGFFSFWLMFSEFFLIWLSTNFYCFCSSVSSTTATGATLISSSSSFFSILTGAGAYFGASFVATVAGFAFSADFASVVSDFLSAGFSSGFLGVSAFLAGSATGLAFS